MRSWMYCVPWGNLYVVRGNNDKDWVENLRTSLSFTIGGVKFFMVHNKKDVAWELGDTQVVIFGHTHKYFGEDDRWQTVAESGKLWKKPFWRRGYHGGDDCGGWQYQVEKSHFGRKIPGNDHNPVYRSFYADPFL